MQDIQSTRQLVFFREIFRDWIFQLTEESSVSDVCLIGNSSEIYQQNIERLVDFDAFIFVHKSDASFGNIAFRAQQKFLALANELNIEFHLRVLDGSFKPNPSKFDASVFFAHLGIFTDSEYLCNANLRRWAWRKYVCKIEPGRLQRLAPSPPDLREFMHGDKGLLSRMCSLKAPHVNVRERLLPSLEWKEFMIAPSDEGYIDLCFSYAAATARNHARSLGRIEADTLDNQDFFEWYNNQLFSSRALYFLMEQKSKRRSFSEDISVREARNLALNYMEGLLNNL